MSRLNHSVPQGEGHMTISLIFMSHLYNTPSWESTLSRGFHKLDEIGNNANIGIRGFTMWKIIQWQNVTSSGNRTGASHSPWFQVQHYPLYTTLTFAYKTETLGSLYNHALLIPLKSSKSKYQVVHEQKFKDLLSSTCQVSVERIVLDLESEVMRERIVLDLESEVMRDPGSIPTGGNILSLDFFSHSKASDANIGIIANVVCLWKSRVN